MDRLLCSLGLRLSQYDLFINRHPLLAVTFDVASILLLAVMTIFHTLVAEPTPESGEHWPFTVVLVADDLDLVIPDADPKRIA